MTSKRWTGSVEAESFLPLSNASFHILLALSEVERHGYAIMQDVRTSTQGSVRLGPGTLYRSLQTLLDDLLIEERAPKSQSSADSRRRYYRLTPLGRRVLVAETQRLAGIVAMATKRVLLKQN